MVNTLFANIVQSEDPRRTLHEVSANFAPSGVRSKMVGSLRMFCVHNKSSAFIGILDGEQLVKYISTYSSDTTKELIRLATRGKHPHRLAKVYQNFIGA